MISFNILGKRKSCIGKVVLNFYMHIGFENSKNVLFSPYNFMNRSTLKKYLC